jgi:Fe-S-cluster containining protein
MDDVSEKHRFLDRLTGALIADYRAKGGQIHCGRGCCNCCSLAVNCTYPEALILAEGLDEDLLRRVDGYANRLKTLMSGVTGLKEYLRLHRSDSGGCPLLGADGACRAYGLRPLSCRALLATRESRWCGADFSAISPAEKEEFIASLDRTVTAFPLHYLASAQDAGRELERQTLLAMVAEQGFSIYGTMPVLVHLAARHGLTTAVAGGVMAVRELLVRTGLDSPLLLQIEEV